ncbi:MULTISPECIES: branched-chain amino acid ABC transporter ATP-binding protein/permease [Comamonas]|jgi:branched-chain amino acid transport system permease protein|uniref:Branched-chain amino acid ABC transporter ATP-binding protein/permease n=1 Tax=Comamonas squillarum TaxID=2977320 RepID=A0ABY5ZRV3_9BURK|nr:MULTISPECIES: branched-chain amino acid ABC transporter ATP-binding protein/permease [Comamonas]PWB17749.1 ABC transporter ATP-binding protein [Comamonas sp. JNW]UXC16616.1 branched-chain amino acid ABC transporter ATP-binding protein/permease [Comamonas sp. PR12]
MNSEIKHYGWLALVAALVAAIPLMTSNDFYLRIVFLIGVNYIAASGLNVLVNYTGQKSLGHAGLFAVGAYAVALLTTRWGWNPWAAFAMAGVLAGLFGVVIALPALRVKGPALAMVTIGFGIVVEKVVSEWQDVFAGQQGIYGVVPLKLGDQMFASSHWVWFVLALCVVLHVMFRHLLAGRFGRAFMAVNTAEVAAESVGVSVYKFKVLAFVISAFTCGIAGALITQQNQYINSDFITFNLSVFFLLVVLFGGNSVYGPLLGAVVLTLLDSLLSRWPGVQHFTYGALLLFALYAMPNGLAGTLRSLARKYAPGLLPTPQLPQDLPAWQLKSAAPLASTGAEGLLDGRGIYKAYGGVVPTNEVDLCIKPGHVHSLIGPNGAGKTTLLNILSGIVVPERGSIQFAGQSIVGVSPNRIARMGLGRTFQNLRLFSDMTVLDNVKVGLHAHIQAGFFASLIGVGKARRAELAARDEALQILDRLQLRDKALHTAGSLPYGLQRRLELARALATHPRLLLLDEPAAGLNPQETQELIQVIARIRDLGITVLLIEHHMDLVMAVSDHVIVLDYGQKIAEGTPQQVQSNPRVIAAYLGSDDETEDNAMNGGPHA